MVGEGRDQPIKPQLFVLKSLCCVKTKFYNCVQEVYSSRKLNLLRLTLISFFLVIINLGNSATTVDEEGAACSV